MLLYLPWVRACISTEMGPGTMGSPSVIIAAAKKLKQWKKTVDSGCLAKERDWLLSFDHPNILPYVGTVVVSSSSHLMPKHY